MGTDPLDALHDQRRNINHTVEQVLNEISDKGEFGWVVISNASNNKVDGWVIIRKNTKGKERGYELGKEPTKDKGASLLLPRDREIAIEMPRLVWTSAWWDRR